MTGRKFSVYGPTTVGLPQRHGSIMFCEPCAQTLLPTNTTSAIPYSPISSPVVSARNTRRDDGDCGAAGASALERRTHSNPAARMLSSTASAFSKWRGAITSVTPSRPFTTFRSIWSSPGHVEPPRSILSPFGTPPFSSQADISRSFAALRCATSNLKLPETSTVAGSAPAATRRALSSSLCAKIPANERNTSENHHFARR